METFYVKFEGKFCCQIQSPHLTLNYEHWGFTGGGMVNPVGSASAFIGPIRNGNFGNFRVTVEQGKENHCVP